LSYDETTNEYEVCFLSEDEIRARPALQSVLIELLNSLGDLANPKPTIAKGTFDAPQPLRVSRLSPLCLGWLLFLWIDTSF